MLERVLASSVIRFFLWTACCTAAFAACKWPDTEPKNGYFVYQKPGDQKNEMAPNLYVLKFRCHMGYRIMDKESALCFNGAWTSSVQNCIELQCPDPPSLPNGEYVLNTTRVDRIYALAHYSCNDGYRMENDSLDTLQCLLNRKANLLRWKGPFLTECIPKGTCPDPGESPDGWRKGGCCYSGDQVEYGCKEGFELVGPSMIECLSTGGWSSKRPRCRPEEEHCEMPPPIKNGLTTGERKGDYYLPEDEVQVVCKPGYKYSEPSEYVICEEETGWDAPFGECAEFFCNHPGYLENGSIPELESGNLSFPYDFELTYICDKGFRLVGDSWRYCSTRGWSGKKPRCEPVRCPDPGVPEYGYRKGNSFEIGSEVIFQCFSGFDLLGSIERFCMPNGQWSGDLASCNLESNFCPDPGIPVNGMKNSSRYDLGERIRFICSPGHILLGTEIRECLENRTWSGEEVKCISPYDYDNTGRVLITLQQAIEEKAEESQKYERMARQNSVMGRRLDLSEGRIILYFLFDASGSVKQKNFARSVEFAKALTKKVKVSPAGARVGALTFSSSAEVKFLPLDYDTTDQVLDALDALNYTGGGTSASSALREVRTVLIPTTQASLGKRGMKSVIFILTDGKANMGGDPQHEARILKEDGGVEIYCVGITGDIMQERLYSIASDPKEEHVFILQNYQALEFLMQEITSGSIDYSQCGLGQESWGRIERSRIIGGASAREPWPWIAALYFTEPGSRDRDNAILQCGGSIISENLVMTAAHCMFSKLGQRSEIETIVKLGLTNVTNKTHAQNYGVKNYFIHPRYRDGVSYDYDIAILQLDQNIKFTAYVRPICLPPAVLNDSSTLYKPGEPAVAIGWGHEGVVEDYEKVSLKSIENLKQVFMPIQPSKTCRQTAEGRGLFTERMICAGDGKGNDTCRGDSGGPLMRKQMDNEGNTYWTEIGLVSWGIGCGQPNTYGYYTNIQTMRSWIDQVTEQVAASEQENRHSEEELQLAPMNR